MSTPSRRIEDVRIGESLPPLSFETSSVALVAYAGATWDFHRLHHDAGYATARGLAGPVMDGQMIGALIARMLMAWAGPDAFVTRLGYRLRAPVHVGDRIVLTGTVGTSRLEPTHGFATIGVDVVIADGTVVVRDAQAIVRLPRRTGT